MLVRDAVALDVGGTSASGAWGAQWNKVLRVLGAGTKEGLVGMAGPGRTVVGGESPEGKAARVRVELEVERLLV